MVSSTNRPNRNDSTKSTFKVQLKILEEEENSLFHLFSVAKKMQINKKAVGQM